MRLVTFVCFTVSCFASPVSFAQVPASSTDRDPYGGWNHLKFEPTGFFRVAKRDGVWWLVTPQGNSFLSKGVNNVSFRADDAPALGQSPYQHEVQGKYGSQEAWAEAVVNRLRGWGFNTTTPFRFSKCNNV